MSRDTTTIGSRLTRYIVLLALLVTLAAMALTMFFRYKYEVQNIIRSAEAVRSIYAPQIAQGIWDYSDENIKAQVESLGGLKYLAWARLKTSDRELSTGVKPAAGEPAINRSFEMVHPLWGSLGKLEISFSLREVRRAVVAEGLNNLGVIFLPFVVMAVATLFLFRRLVTRHLDALAEYSRSITLDTLGQDFKFNRTMFERRNDELDRLLESFNFMKDNLSREIASRLEAEEKLFQTENIYRQIFNCTGDAIFLHDADTFEILDVNDTMLRMYGLESREEACNRLPSVLSADEQHFSMEEAARRLILARQGEPQLFEWQAKRSDGMAFWVEVSLHSMAPLVPGRILAVVRDISRRKEAEAEVLQYQKMESLGRIVGGIAHDFNNLLAGIIPPAEIISLEAHDPEHREMAETIFTTGKRAAELTERLLAFTRKSVIVTKPVNMHILIQDAITMLKRSLDPKIELRLDLKAEKRICMGDEGQLVSLLLNLGLNARDAMPEGGQLTISSRNHSISSEESLNIPFAPIPGPYIMISVIDSGMGMSEDVINRAMEPFFTTKDPGKGTGLGLSSVYRTAMDHGGYITIDSTPDLGTEVHFSLPLRQDKNLEMGIDQQIPSEKISTEISGEISEISEISQEHPILSAPSPSAHTPVSSDPSRAWILIIDDDKAARASTEIILTRLGYSVETAENGLQGTEILFAGDRVFDLVILDMVMPVMNGPETLSVIRERSEEIKVLIVSGCAMNEDVEAILLQDIQGYLRKPFTVDGLSDAVQKALGRA